MDLYSELRTLRKNPGNVFFKDIMGPYINEAGTYRVTIPCYENTLIKYMEIRDSSSNTYTGIVTIVSPSVGELYSGDASNVSSMESFSAICNTYTNPAIETPVLYFNRTEDISIIFEITEETKLNKSLQIIMEIMDLSAYSCIKKLN